MFRLCQQALHCANYMQLFLSDPDAKFSKSIGWADAASGRTGRYAVVIDHGKVTYADIETERGSLKVGIPCPTFTSVANCFT